MRTVDFLTAIKQDKDFRCVENNTKFRITANGDVIMLNEDDQFIDYATINRELLFTSKFVIESSLVKCNVCDGERFISYQTKYGDRLHQLCSNCNGTGYEE